MGASNMECGHKNKFNTTTPYKSKILGNCLGSNKAPVSACMPQVWQSWIENPARYSDLCKPQYVP